MVSLCRRARAFLFAALELLRVHLRDVRPQLGALLDRAQGAVPDGIALDEGFERVEPMAQRGEIAPPGLGQRLVVLADVHLAQHDQRDGGRRDHQGQRGVPAASARPALGDLLEAEVADRAGHVLARAVELQHLAQPRDGLLVLALVEQVLGAREIAFDEVLDHPLAPHERGQRALDGAVAGLHLAHEAQGPAGAGHVAVALEARGEAAPVEPTR
jgi:hypothetical protein